MGIRSTHGDIHILSTLLISGGDGSGAYGQPNYGSSTPKYRATVMSASVIINMNTYQRNKHDFFSIA